MARDFAKINAAIWQDDEWRDLPPLAQHLYLVILSDPELSYCGVTDWRPKRIAPKARGWTVEDIETAGKVLTEAHLLVIDEETEEVLVRSFLRHDGVMGHNKLCISAMNAFSAVASNALRGVIVHELNRLKNEFPDWPAWGRQQVIEVLKRRALDPRLAPSVAPGLGPSETSIRPKRKDALASALQQQQQQQHTTATEESKDSSVDRAKRATLPPEDYQPTAELVEWQKTEYPHLNAKDQTERYIDYCRANGKLYIDHDRAWRNWIKKADEYYRRDNRHLHAVTEPWQPEPGSPLSYVEM